MARVPATVKTVTDDDTFKTTLGTVIRLARVNTPERGKPGWLQAKRDLESLILGKKTPTSLWPVILSVVW